MSEVFELCCKPGDIFYGTKPNEWPKKVRRYEVISIKILEDEIWINCDDGEWSMVKSFEEWKFKRIMYRTMEEAESASPPPFRDSEIMELGITNAFK